MEREKNPVNDTMDKFSDYKKRRILGSEDKLQDFMQGVEIESIFNRVRPRYPISMYREVLGYNGGMEKLTKKNITKDEVEVVEDWLRYTECKKIRNCFYGEIASDKYKKEALILENMFNKYDSGLNKSEHIFRGIRFDKNDEIFNILVDTYKQAKVNDGLIRIDKAPSSFTRDKKVAFEEFARATDDNYNSLVFQLTKRLKGELYIKEFAGKFAYQDEIVVKSHNSLYKVKSINEEDGLIIIQIEEFKDE